MFSLVILLFAPAASMMLPPFWPPFMGHPFFEPPALVNMPFTSFGSPYDSIFPFSTGRREICTKIDDIPGLKFPPYSEIPKDGTKERRLLKESVEKYTYKCRHYNGKVFYMLRSSAVFATGNIYNKQNTANYYDEHKMPVSYESLKINDHTLWDFIEREEEKNSVHNHAKVFSPFWPPYSEYLQTWKNIESSTPKCEVREEVDASKYPKVDVSDLAKEDVKKTKHETYLCKNPKTGENTILLKTSVNIWSAQGEVVNRSQTVMIPADKDGNPIETNGEPIQTGASQSVSSHNFLTTVSKDFTRGY